MTPPTVTDSINGIVDRIDAHQSHVAPAFQEGARDVQAHLARALQLLEDIRAELVGERGAEIRSMADLDRRIGKERRGE